ncbi:MAG: lysine--tRNA ligase [Candidatus Shapirobacteria bacterium]|jgi:lysyl-tRNA synthetase class 2
MPIDELRQQRHRKLAELKKLNLDPYPQPNLKDKTFCLDVPNFLGQEVTVAGRLMSVRGHGQILFADLIDRSGKIQLFFQQKNLTDLFSQTKLIDLGDILSATGTVIKTQAGEITVDVKSFVILAKNLSPLPEKWHGLKDIEERYRRRYLDLIVNPDVKEVFLTRIKILTLCRQFLDSHGFLEVETPILQPIYGGASAKPFETFHNELDMKMYLRISDELYLKRLIVGGLEKVYEVSRDFRNEGVSRFHNPEFTQIEFYWAYVDYEVLMSFTEELITYLLAQIKNTTVIEFQGTKLDFTPPYKRLTFRQAILGQTGIDIDLIKTEADFHQEISQKKLKLDTKDAIGLGELFDTLYKEYARPLIIQPTFVTDYPASMIALAKRKASDPSKISSFQLLAAGAEILKAYNELNDPQDQKERWQDEEALAKKGSQTAMQLDTDYIEALEYGMPPTAGWGMGIDRLTQFFTDQPSVKDTIFFPAMKPASAPSANNNEIGVNSPKVIIGKITGIEPHPQADKLHLCQVDISSDKALSIICSCSNISVGNIVAVALPGAIVHAPNKTVLKINKSKMRGIQSDAMMCSPLELGFSQKHDCLYLLPPGLSQHLGEPLNLHLADIHPQN